MKKILSLIIFLIIICNIFLGCDNAQVQDENSSITLGIKVQTSMKNGKTDVVSNRNNMDKKQARIHSLKTNKQKNPTLNVT